MTRLVGVRSALLDSEEESVLLENITRVPCEQALRDLHKLIEAVPVQIENPNQVEAVTGPCLRSNRIAVQGGVRYRCHIVMLPGDKDSAGTSLSLLTEAALVTFPVP